MDKLKPCPCCHITNRPYLFYGRRFGGWRSALMCSHASCDFAVKAWGLTLEGSKRRAIKKWNRRENDG